MRSVWDESKARSNQRKHRVRFEVAAGVFLDAGAAIEDDVRCDYGEERFVAVGYVDGTMLAVAFTEPEADTIRIISARKATRHEREAYYGLHP